MNKFYAEFCRNLFFMFLTYTIGLGGYIYAGNIDEWIILFFGASVLITLISFILSVDFASKIKED